MKYGIASNFLCNATPGKQVTLTGAVQGTAFKVPADKTSNLLMIGTGTGIAPFRTLIKSVYAAHGGWQGKCVFYGAKSGLDNLYMNDQNNDLANYYDEAAGHVRRSTPTTASRCGRNAGQKACHRMARKPGC